MILLDLVGGLERLSFECFDFCNRHFKRHKRCSDFGLIQFTSFGEVDGDAAVDVSSCDSIELFQGHTGLFISVCSSGA